VTNAALDDDAAVGLLTKVVALPSPSGAEAAVAEALVSAASPSAEAAFVDAAGNAVAVWGTGPLKVTFLGHMDTVPGHIPVRVQDGVLHGRGAVDAKGSLCAALVAATRLPAAFRDQATFTFIAATEEEAPSSRGANYAAATYPRPDHLLIGEPSGWQRYTLGYKGRLGVTLSSVRQAAHSSRDEASASERALDAYALLRDWVAADNQGADGLFQRLQLALIAIDSASDGLTESCRASASLRIPPRWTAAQLLNEIAALQWPAGVTPAFTQPLDAHRASNRSELARAFRVAIRKEGGNPTPSLKTGTSDMNVVAPSWSVPMLAYGPGDSKLDHTPNEQLPLAEFLTCCRVLRHALLELVAASA
jgi:LysW-gamma-L-lysine carboxypeptidase